MSSLSDKAVIRLHKRVEELEAQLETYRKIDKKRFTHMTELEAQLADIPSPADLYTRIEELEAQVAKVHERVLGCQQYTTNSAMVHEGRFMEVVAIKAALDTPQESDNE